MKKKGDAKKSERSTLVVEPSTPKEILSPEVPFRGLKLGDKVAYYSKNGNKSGVGYVFSKTEFAPGTGITSMMKIRDSLTNIFGFGIELHYDSKNDKFMDGIKECEIIKL